MTEKGYKGGLVSRVINKHSGKKYIVSTAQEIGKDYWSSIVAPSRFLVYGQILKKDSHGLGIAKKRHTKFIIS